MGPRGVGLVKAVEHTTEVFFVDATACVGYRQDHLSTRLVDANRYRHPAARWSEANPVVEQIAKDLAKLSRIPRHLHRTRRGLEHQTNRTLLSHPSEHGDCLSGDRREIDLFTRRRTVLIARLGQEQQVVG